MSDKDSGGSGKQDIDPRVAKRRQDALGRQLQSMYDNVVSEPVPDDFFKILEQMDERPASSKPGKPNGSAGGKDG